MCIEFNHLIPNSVNFVQEKNFQIKQGSSARSLVELANSKNYQLVATSFSNLFFVDKSYSHTVIDSEIFIDDLIDDS